MRAYVRACVQVQSLEAQLEQSCVKQQLEALQRQLELLEVEKKEADTRMEEAEKKNKELEDRGGRGQTPHTHTHTRSFKPTHTHTRRGWKQQVESADSQHAIGLKGERNIMAA